jgi:hypothetical protein
MVDKTLMTKPLNYVLGKDIAKFFDVVCHNCLMKCLKQRVVGPSLLRIITRLANIYPSYALDRWFECVVKKRLTGFALLVRYVDDLIVCFQNGWEAEVFGKALWKRLVKFRLTISEGFKRRVCAPEESDEEKPQILFCVGAHSNPGAITPIGGGL